MCAALESTAGSARSGTDRPASSTTSGRTTPTRSRSAHARRIAPRGPVSSRCTARAIVVRWWSRAAARDASTRCWCCCRCAACRRCFRAEAETSCTSGPNARAPASDGRAPVGLLATTPRRPRRSALFGLARRAAPPPARRLEHASVRTRAPSTTLGMAACRRLVLFAVAFVGAIAPRRQRAPRGRRHRGRGRAWCSPSRPRSTSRSAAVRAAGRTAHRPCSRRLRWLAASVARAARRRPAATGRCPTALTRRHRARRRRRSRYPGTDDACSRDVDLHLPAGATVAIVGENGAGKTTLVKLLCRFYEPTAGRSRRRRRPPRSPVDEWRGRISAGFQDFARFELPRPRDRRGRRHRRASTTDAVAAALGRAHAGDIIARSPTASGTLLGTATATASTYPAGSGRSWPSAAR